MAEYIEREHLLRKFNIDDMMNVNGALILLNDARNVIEKQPAADVAPVVRCKDCTHTTLYEDSEGLYCTNICGLLTRVMDDDYCSYGERKGGGDT